MAEDAAAGMLFDAAPKEEGEIKAPIIEAASDAAVHANGDGRRQEEGAAMESIGSTLRAAREAAGMTIADAARALNLAPRQIESLERDDFAALPAAVFTRGFVRNYARLLKLDCALLMARLDAVLPLPANEVRLPIRPPKGGQGAKGAPRAWLVAAILLIAVGLPIGLHYHEMNPEVFTQRFFAPEKTDIPIEQPIPRASDAGPAAMPQVGEMANAASSSPNASVPPAASVSGSQNETEPRSLAPAPPLAALIQLTFAGRSWVEVVDGRKRVLFRGENSRGSSLDLSGEPPFELVIGNAKEVTLRYRGENVDLVPYTRAEVARLKLE